MLKQVLKKEGGEHEDVFGKDRLTQVNKKLKKKNKIWKKISTVHFFFWHYLLKM